jgi:hypothetical protein
MKKYSLILFLFLTALVGFAQDLYVSNNTFVYVDGNGFAEYDATTNPNGAALFVTDDIQLAGANSIIYLRNEAQLLQQNDAVTNSGTGYLERGQKGTASLYNYNYWGSPVWSSASSFTLDDILFNGTNPSSVQPINWSSAYDANYGTNPITMSSYWVFAYDNNTVNDYNAWEHRGESTAINHGLGFTMKGSGSGNGSQFQEYMFRGIPNNGTITNNLSPGNQTLVGNPYPSAIDAREFIRDNIPGGNPGTTTSITGTLLFWRQSTTVNTHYLAVYQGGYAALTLTGGTPAVTPPSEIGGLGDANSVTPGYYIPVAQGFFVDDDGDGSTEAIRFKNSQRFYKKEAVGVSVFLEPNDEGGDNSSSSLTNNSTTDDIQRVRLSFKTPEGASRYLLLGFTPNNEASDAFDYGYDGENFETLPSDLSWSIENKIYIIQGVGSFDENKSYPLNMLLDEKGNIEIAIDELENFDQPIDVYVYDDWLKTSTKLNEINYSNTFEQGTYEDRFYIAFKDQSETLENPEVDASDFMIYQNNNASLLTIVNPNNLSIQSLSFYDVTGKEIFNHLDLPLKTKHEFSTKDLSEGVYLVSLKTSSHKTLNKKVIITN